jgi:subtilisin-like proprotein convertase family protein
MRVQGNRPLGKASAGTRETDAPAGLVIERGGERFVLEKTPDLFAVRKRPRPRSSRGELTAADDHPEAFPGLAFKESHSGREIEVYRVEAGALEEAMAVLRTQSPEIIWCAHVYHMPGDPTGLMVPTEAIYVEFAAGADQRAIARLLDEHGLEMMPDESGQPGAFVLRLTAASTQNPIKIATALRESGLVDVAEPDFAMKMALHLHRPTDPLFPQQWHLENLGGPGLTAGADVAAPAAWDLTRGDRAIVVAVIDDGVQLSHPDFASPGKIVAPFDFGQSDLDPSPVAVQDNHGTACAGVAVADENGTGVVGIAPGCALMPIQSSGIISNQTIQALFDYVRTNGADVVSCSWGVDAAFFTLSTPMINAIRRAAREGRGGRGCVIVFAAGNENSPLDGVVDGTPVRSGFAIHPDVIAVGASNSRDLRSHYSNFGPQLWVCAPSSGAGGRGIVTTDRTGAAGYQVGDHTTVNGFGGTSSATPLVAGICALMLSVNSDLRGDEVRDILRQTAEKIDQAGGSYGPDGHSDLFGFGRVNAFRAVTEARQRRAPTVSRRITFERQPGLAIPDAMPAGVADVLQVGEAGTVAAVEVTVDIQHTYRGDLRVRLVAPDGSAVTLHDRVGFGQDDIAATFRVADVPALAGLAGKAAQGPWTLHVADLASVDTGTLRRWSLTLELSGGPRHEWEVSPGTHIPDDQPQGIVSELPVDGAGALQDMTLEVDITHTFQGDLRVTLETPGGVAAKVHDQTGGPAPNLVRTYRPADTPALQALVDAGVEIHGTWRLLVADLAARDVGKLNHWKLTLRT